VFSLDISWQQGSSIHLFVLSTGCKLRKYKVCLPFYTGSACNRKQTLALQRQKIKDQWVSSRL